MQPNLRNRFILALGSNATADVASNALILREALARIKESGLAIQAISRFWRTPAFPVGAGPEFVNACGVFGSDLPPGEVLSVLHAIEQAMGRVRTTRWAQRVIDLDILAAGDLVLPDLQTLRHWMALSPEAQARETPPGLILPHPRLHQRGFVLVPMAEVAPDWRHPLLGRSVTQLLAALDPAEISAIRPI